MDTIKLMRKVKDEYTYRFYEMTDGTFEEMKDAVKLLPSRQFNGRLKAWHIDKAGYDTLKEQFTIQRLPDFRASEFVTNSIRDTGDPVRRVTAYFEYRDETGDWLSAPISKTLRLEITNEMIEEIKADINASAKEHFPELKLSPTDYHRAVREICRRAVAKYSAEVVEKFEEAMSGKKRTLENLKAAFEAVEEMMEA